MDKLLNLLKRRSHFLAIKDHIIRTKCLDIDLWQNSNYRYYDQVSSRGLSFADVVKNADERLSEWLVILFHLEYDAWPHDFFWKKRRADTLNERSLLTQDDLMLWAIEHGQASIIEALSSRLMRSVSIDDPASETLLTLASQESGNLSYCLQSKITHVRTIIAIVQKIKYYLPDAVINGCYSQLIELAAMYRKMRQMLEMEGWLSAEFVDRIHDLKSIADEVDLLELDNESEPMLVDLLPKQCYIYSSISVNIISSQSYSP